MVLPASLLQRGTTERSQDDVNCCSAADATGDSADDGTLADLLVSVQQVIDGLDPEPQSVLQGQLIERYNQLFGQFDTLWSSKLSFSVQSSVAPLVQVQPFNGSQLPGWAGLTAIQQLEQELIHAELWCEFSSAQSQLWVEILNSQTQRIITNGNQASLGAAQNQRTEIPLRALVNSHIGTSVQFRGICLEYRRSIQDQLLDLIAEES